MIRTAYLTWGTILVAIGSAAAGKVIYLTRIADRICGTILAPACKPMAEVIVEDTWGRPPTRSPLDHPAPTPPS